MIDERWFAVAALLLSIYLRVGLYYSYGSLLFVVVPAALAFYDPSWGPVALGLGLAKLVVGQTKKWRRQGRWALRRRFRFLRPYLPRERMPRELREEVWRRYGRRCVYCGALAKEIDHVIPYWYLEYQGRPPHDIKNLRPACERCNLLAGGRVFENFEEKRRWLLRRRNGD